MKKRILTILHEIIKLVSYTGLVAASTVGTMATLEKLLAGITPQNEWFVRIFGICVTVAWIYFTIRVGLWLIANAGRNK